MTEQVYSALQWRRLFFPVKGVYTSDLNSWPCLLGDDGWGVVPGSVWGPRGSNRGVPFSKSHWGSAVPPGSHHSTHLELGGSTEGMTGRCMCKEMLAPNSLPTHVKKKKKMYLLYYYTTDFWIVFYLLYWWYVVTVIKKKRFFFFSCQNCIPQYYKGHFRRVGE